jgi:penicillin-binding protein 2
MFERRMKFLLGVLLVITGGILLRVMQLQLLETRDWNDKAKDSLRRSQLVDTVRGSILDFRGRVIAQDVACIDACVDYRAIEDPPDEKWVRKVAQQRLRDRADGLVRAERARLLADEVAAVRKDIEGMWETLGRLPGASPEAVAQARREIVQRVTRRQRMVWYRAYAKAMESRSSAATKPAWYKAWLAGDEGDAPQLKDFESEVGDQVESHPILRNISAEVNNYLAKSASRMPGLELKAGIARAYPFGEAGAHVVGYVSRVSKADIDNDSSDDELRAYLPSDTIGRSGLEALAESRLRGRRGRILRVAGQSGSTEETAAVDGETIHSTIDIDLEQKIQGYFANAEFEFADKKRVNGPMHGAAVVIDVASGEVRAMASYPAYDPNTMDTSFAKLALNEIDGPLRNRATQDACEPGSTVKPLVGMGAITQGVLGINETIECTGYLIIGGKRYDVGRCWTMRRAPYLGHHKGGPEPHDTGFLTYTDAIQRSCNVFFENCGDRLGIDGLSFWMDKFGLGRPTGVGVAEVSGLIPNQQPIAAPARKATSWFAGIGQSHVQATPIQMANVAATIARDGIWVRPHLIPGEAEAVDLGINPEAVRAAKLGMFRVVNTEAGSGKEARDAVPGMQFCGKTGTAQAAPFTYMVRDEAGNPILDPKGKPVRAELALSTEANPNALAPWYRGTGESGKDRAHSWFIGFAPADHPQVAFCVLVEYGGSGGKTAAGIVKEVLKACVDAGYLGNKPDGAGESVGDAR